MIGRSRTSIGMFGATLLAMGAISLPPPRRPDVDLDAAEKVMRDLQAAGLDPSAVMEHVGVERFIQWGRAVLDMQLAQRALGCEMTTAGLLDELDRFAQGRSSIVQLGKLCPEHLRESQIIDLQPMHDLGAREVTIGWRGHDLAHIKLSEGAQTLDPRDIISTRPVLRSNPFPRPSPVKAIADLVLDVLRPTPKAAKLPRDRSGKRAARAKARAGKQRRKARRGF